MGAFCYEEHRLVVLRFARLIRVGGPAGSFYAPRGVSADLPVLTYRAPQIMGALAYLHGRKIAHRYTASTNAVAGKRGAGGK